jgi:hypothetical protein
MRNKGCGMRKTAFWAYWAYCRQTGNYPETGLWEVGAAFEPLKLALIGLHPWDAAGGPPYTFKLWRVPRPSFAWAGFLIFISSHPIIAYFPHHCACTS